MDNNIIVGNDGYLLTENGKKFTGIYKEYYSNGFVKSETEIKKGRREGFFKKYDKNGKIEIEGNFKDNKEHGEWKDYSQGHLLITYHNKGNCEKSSIYIKQEGTTKMLLIRELYHLTGLLSSTFYSDIDVSNDLLFRNTFCIKEIANKNQDFTTNIKNYEAGELLYHIYFLKDASAHGPHIKIDAFTENGPVKSISLCENGYHINDNASKRKKILEYYSSNPRISSEGKRMVKMYFNKYPAPISGITKFLRGCFLFFIIIIAILGYLIYKFG
ncbi:toxin-antitoxin system YwqK family antitoxin [Fusobacterium russii]|uniref:toxin-antitoxin system YwqK family antitoxin n=1 Tax=Fusobacterium russii TaxID=854 RepID=UPI0003A3CB6C|nr:hypothetical protein [Fusobacterium russii]